MIYKSLHVGSFSADFLLCQSIW